MSAALAESPAMPMLRHLLAPIQGWLDDPATEDLFINRPGEVWVRARGVTTRHDAPMSYKAMQAIAVLAGSLAAQNVDHRRPICSADMNGLRLQFCLPPVVPPGTVSMVARRHQAGISGLGDATRRYWLDGWNRWKPRHETRDWTELLALYDAGDIHAFLAACVRARLTILLCGSTGAGKTTFLNTLLAEIPDAERLITIEDTYELQLRQPNVVRLRYSKGNLSAAKVTSEDLLQACMRMRPDRIIQAELRDDAAMTWVDEGTAGHRGSMATIHGDHPAQAFKRLFTLCKSSPQGSTWDDRTMIGMLSSAVDLIVPFRNNGAQYQIGEVWFAPDAARRGETAADFLKEG